MSFSPCELQTVLLDMVFVFFFVFVIVFVVVFVCNCLCLVILTLRAPDCSSRHGQAGCAPAARATWWCSAGSKSGKNISSFGFRNQRYIIINIIIIIITRPKPAFGRQGLAGRPLRASRAQLGSGKWSFFMTNTRFIIIYITSSSSSS